MLTVAKITTQAAGGYADYLEGKATVSPLGDYYLKDGERVEAPGRWVTGSPAIGCDPRAAVSGDALRELMAVRRPDNGQPLRKTGSSGEAVAAIDATFSAPKSVSAIWALGGPGLRQRIEQAHEQAISRSVQYAIQQVRMIRERVGPGTVVHALAADVVASSWRHTTARSVGERLPDPQLHSHVLLHGAVRQDGRLVAIDSRSWLVHRRELGAAYRTELAHRLSELGFEIQRGTGRGGRYFEIAGVPSQLTDRWSSRHHQVRLAIQQRLIAKRAWLLDGAQTAGTDPREVAEQRAALERAVRLSAGEDRLATSFSRSGKQPHTIRDLDQQWAKDARDAGFPPSAISQLRSGTRSTAAGVHPGLVECALTEFDATFTWRDARAVALEQAAGAPIEQALGALERLRSDQRLLELADGQLTTSTHRAHEHNALDAAAQTAAQRVEPIPTELVEAATRKLEGDLHVAGLGLTDEQRQAIVLACGDRPLVVIEGQAGTGKSTVLRAVARAHQDAGQLIVVTSTSGLAAHRLAGELAEHEAIPVCFSTAGLLTAIRDGRLPLNPWVTVIHDEAALASTRELEPLLTKIRDNGARLVMLGDPEQSHPVGAGGLWSYLDDAAATQDASVELTQNVRALDPADRRDQKRFRSGESELALRGYAARNRLHVHDIQQQAEDEALDAADQDRRHGLRTLVVAQTSNDQLDELNARAQAIRLQQGELGQESLPLQGRPYRLHAGDEIQIRRTIPHSTHGRLHNGTTATITHVDTGEQTAHLRLSTGESLPLTIQQLDQASARLAYVQHPFPAQGATSDTSHLIAAEHITKEGSYVALTRARTETHIHASHQLLDMHTEPGLDPVVRLAEHMSRAEPDLPSIATPLGYEQTIDAHEEHEQANPTRGLEPALDQEAELANEPPELAAPEPHSLTRKWRIATARHLLHTRDLDRGDGWEP